MSTGVKTWAFLKKKGHIMLGKLKVGILLMMPFQHIIGQIVQFIRDPCGRKFKKMPNTGIYRKSQHGIFFINEMKIQEIPKN
jgi:hypothetical protein